MYALIVVLFGVVVLVNSAPTYHVDQLRQEGLAVVSQDFAPFKTAATNCNKIKKYVKDVKEYLEKAVPINVELMEEAKNILRKYKAIIKGTVEQENIDWEELETINQKPKEKIEEVKTILDFTKQWVNRRIDDVTDPENKEVFRQIQEKSLEIDHYFNAFPQMLTLNELILEYRATPEKITTAENLVIFLPLIDAVLGLQDPVVNELAQLINQIK